ncbi:MAG TPA: 2-phosphosulfolactate phosphatase [Pirellulales bacterium]|nr:2-phosphosulfolactate phosphatase [Pirellulales bacterium]
MLSLKAHFLPSLTTPDELEGAAVVVIDVLRATTVITHALAAGAREVVPCLEVDDALRVASALPKGRAVLGGERGGLKIEGFDLGNSPNEFTHATIGGKTLVFTTTNGTRAMMHCQRARRVLIGAFVNASAVVQALADEEKVHLLCAGTRGAVTREDVLLAGLIADRLLDLPGAAETCREINDELLIARTCWQAFAAGRQIPDLASDLAATLRFTQGGRNLTKIGLEHDIDAAACIDRFSIVPELDARQWRIASGRGAAFPGRPPSSTA